MISLLVFEYDKEHQIKLPNKGSTRGLSSIGAPHWGDIDGIKNEKASLLCQPAV